MHFSQLVSSTELFLVYSNTQNRISKKANKYQACAYLNTKTIFHYCLITFLLASANIENTNRLLIKIETCFNLRNDVLHSHYGQYFKSRARNWDYLAIIWWKQFTFSTRMFAVDYIQFRIWGPEFFTCTKATGTIMQMINGKIINTNVAPLVAKVSLMRVCSSSRHLM